MDTYQRALLSVLIRFVYVNMEDIVKREKVLAAKRKVCVLNLLSVLRFMYIFDNKSWINRQLCYGYCTIQYNN